MIKFFKILLSVLILLIISSSYISAQVVINEVFPNPPGEESGAEWVELYNLDGEVASLANCTLYLDDDYDPQKVVFNSDDFVDKFKVILWDGSWLNNQGDQLRLVCESNSDLVSYGNAAGFIIEAPEEDTTFGRTPDGTGNFSLLETPTLGDYNSGPPPTPIPTNTPTQTSVITPTNTPTLSPTKTPTPTKTPSPKPTVKLSPTQKPTVTESPTNNQTEDITQNLVLGERNQLTPVPSEIESTKVSRKVPLTAGLFILGGLGFMGAAAYPMIKNRKKGI